MHNLIARVAIPAMEALMVLRVTKYPKLYMDFDPHSGDLVVKHQPSDAVVCRLPSRIIGDSIGYSKKKLSRKRLKRAVALIVSTVDTKIQESLTSVN